MVKHTQTIRRQQPTNCLSVFDHFVGLALKELMLLSLSEKCKWTTWELKLVLSVSYCVFFAIRSLNSLSANATKLSYTQTIRRQIANELFDYVWPFCGVVA